MRDDSSPDKSKRRFFSSPNVSSLARDDLLRREKLKKSRRPSSKADGQAPILYNSANNIHDTKTESNRQTVVRTLERLNMMPTNKNDGQPPQSQSIPKLSQSLAMMVDEATCPSEFNHVREDIIMEKITAIHASNVSVGKEGYSSVQDGFAPSIASIHSADITGLLSYTHKSRANNVAPSNQSSIIISEKNTVEGLFGKFKKLFKSAKREDKSESETVDHLHASIDWSQLVPDPKKYVPKPYSWGTIQRLRKLKLIYNRMKDPEKGIKYNTVINGSNVKYLKESFTGI